MLRITLLVICLVIIIGFLGFKIYTGKIGNKVKYDNGHFGIATYPSNIDFYGYKLYVNGVAIN